MAGHGQLVISPVDAATDQGHYQYEAFNDVGNDISAITALHAHSPPLVQLLDGNSAAARRGSPGSSTTLRCPSGAIRLSTSSGAKIPSFSTAERRWAWASSWPAN